MKVLEADDVRALLREECRKAGKAQAVAIAIGISEAMVSRILSGEREPGEQVAKFFNLSKVWIDNASLHR